MSDKIECYVEIMNKRSEAGDYNEANRILNLIKAELEKPDETNDTGFSFDNLKRIVEGTQDPITIKETYNIITGNSIRLNPDSYPFNKFLRLALDVHKRLSLIRNPYKCSNDNLIRKIVAEEMIKNELTVPVSDGTKRTKPKPKVRTSAA